MAAAGPASGAARLKLWDLPVRLVHWSFVLLLPSLWWSWRSGDIELHQRLGYVTLSLLLFRIFWGFAGSSTARFKQFVKGPRAIAAYLSGRSAPPFVGHNPLGGWSVLLLLGLMSAEVLLGLFTQDVDAIESGPLTRYVSYETAEAAREWHDLLFYLLLGAVLLHVAAILFYLLVKRDNLVGPMISGRKVVEAGGSEPRIAPLWHALIWAMIAAGISYWVSLGCPF